MDSFFEGQDAGNLTSLDQPNATAGDSRWRDIFPLPLLPAPGQVRKQLSKTTRQRLSKANRWTQWANSGIAALNAMYGFRSSAPHVQNALQEKSLQHIKTSYQRACETLSESMTPAESLHALLAKSSLYGDSCTIVPYCRDRVSWPAIGASPTALETCALEADILRLRNGCEPLLRPPCEAESLRNELQLQRPYSDPSLVNCPKKYSGFLWRLQQAGMIKFSVRFGSRNSTVGIFFVQKTNGDLRLIFDTRIANCTFHEPPSTRLPTSAALSGIESDSQENYVATGDIECAFYNIGIPARLSEEFVLPSISARHLGLRVLDGLPVPADAVILPLLSVLPMGWNWALHFCQSVVTNALHIASFDRHRQVLDGSSEAHISGYDSTVAAGYVDNFAIVGSDRDLVQQKRDEVCHVLKAQFNLPVHELCDSQPSGEFVGLVFSDGRHWNIKPKRMHRLRDAIACVLQRGRASGDLVRILIGHITFVCLLRRESLSFLHALYAFADKNLGRVAPLWHSVIVELQCVMSILPLLHVDISAPWSTHVAASDASLFGLGGCEKVLPAELVGTVGRQSERWRFSAEASIQARSHALDVPESHTQHLSSVNQLSHAVHNDTRHFAEVPEIIYKDKGWRNFMAIRVRGSRGILNLEARAFVSALKHQLRRLEGFHKRHLCIVDNMALCLALCKGRSSAPPLLHPLRQAACLLLVTGSRIGPRWVPSERNYSDKSSRGEFGFWGHMPRRFEFEHNGGPLTHSSGGGGGAAPVGGSVHSDVDSSSRILSKPKLVLDRRTLPGPCSSSVFRLPFPGGLRKWHRSQNHQCARPLLPRDISVRQRDSSSGKAGTSRMGEPASNGPAPAHASLCSISSVCHPCGNAATQHGCMGNDSVLRLPPPKRGHEISRVQFNSAHQGGEHSLGVDSQRSVSGGRGKDRVVRREHSRDRLISVPCSRSFESEPSRTRETVSFLHGQPQEGVPCRLSAPSAWRAVVPSLLSPTRRGEPRLINASSHSSGSSAKRTLGIAEKFAQVCEGEPTFGTDQQDEPGISPSVQTDRALFRGPVGRKIQALHPFSASIIAREKQPAKPKACAQSTQKAQRTPLVERLRREFQTARRNSINGNDKVILEIFSGAGGIGKKLRHKGYGVISIDILHGDHHDVLRNDVFNLIKGWLSSKLVLCVWLGTPCSSWSAARHGPAGSSWCRLRTKENLYGLPNLGDRAQSAVGIGNRLMQRTASVLRICDQLQIPAFLENPASSMLWSAPPIAEITNRESAKISIHDACAYGARWRKRTKIMALHSFTDSSLHHTCSGRHGVCSFTSKPHIVLTGTDPSTKRLWTRIAEPYPARLCAAYARHIASILQRRRIRAVSEILRW